MKKNALILRPKIKKLTEWLTDKRTDLPTGKYSHILLVEQVGKRATIIKDLSEYVDSAHEPARRHLRHLLGFTLNPINQNISEDPAKGYPEDLDKITLQGYFGEIFAGIIAEHYPHFESSRWEVPVYLFHTHDVAFQQLELAKLTGADPSHVPGRTGDDCLAFERDSKGNIIRVMFCESKCTAKHNATLIKEAHEKISALNILPVDLARIIEALLLIPEDASANQWIDALRRLYFRKDNLQERCDMVLYICGRPPKINDTWIHAAVPHASYKGKRKLTAVEVHMLDVIDMVKTVYKGV